jgi:hypothetical protein
MWKSSSLPQRKYLQNSEAARTLFSIKSLQVAQVNIAGLHPNKCFCLRSIKDLSCQMMMSAQLGYFPTSVPKVSWLGDLLPYFHQQGKYTSVQTSVSGSQRAGSTTWQKVRRTYGFSFPLWKTGRKRESVLPCVLLCTACQGDEWETWAAQKGHGTF